MTVYHEDNRWKKTCAAKSCWQLSVWVPKSQILNKSLTICLVAISVFHHLSDLKSTLIQGVRFWKRKHFRKSDFEEKFALKITFWPFFCARSSTFAFFHLRIALFQIKFPKVIFIDVSRMSWILKRCFHNVPYFECKLSLKISFGMSCAFRKSCLEPFYWLKRSIFELSVS